MFKVDDFYKEDMIKVMENALIENFREHLRNRILEVLEPDIKAAIDKAVVDLEVAIVAHADPMGQRLVINAIFKKAWS